MRLLKGSDNMQKMILIRFGDSTLKGKNKKRFIDKLVSQIERKTKPLGAFFKREHDRLYVTFEASMKQPIIERLKTISGIHSFSPVDEIPHDLDTLKDYALHVFKSLTMPSSFRIKVKRAYKKYPLTSIEVAKKISAYLLKEIPGLTVDLDQADFTLTIEIREHHAYMYHQKIKGLGGFPVGIAGKGLLLLSGGLDSPVAGFLSMKQGVQIEAIHFESTPLTSIESAQKVIDIVKALSVYADKEMITLHLVPFKAMHEKIMNVVPSPYHITIMRRMMMRYAEALALKDHTPIIITGDSIGQVASQTLDSMNTINKVTNRPVIRPLATTDKEEITKLAKMIQVYEIASRPFDDCCSIYVPKQPAIHPRDYYASRYEGWFDYKPLLSAMLEDTKTIQITSDTVCDLPSLGLTVSEAINTYLKE
jgi:thiamine biosynthesis protein ThiI